MMENIEEDSENIEEDEELSETTEKDIFICPNCEGEVDHLIKRGYSWVKCPRCDKGIRQAEIPKKYHYLIKKVAGYKSKEKKKEEEKEITLPSVEPEEGEADLDRIPFDRPQEHWQVLNEILTSFGVDKRTQSLIVARARRQKQPMNPQDVQRLLATFKSGLKKGELTYVAEEYYLALESERKKRKERTSSRSQYYPRYDDEEADDEYRGIYPSSRGGSDRDDEEIPVWERGRAGKYPTFEDLNRFRDDLKRDNKVRELERELREKDEEANYLRSRPPADSNKDMDIVQLMIEQQQQAHKEMMQIILNSSKDKSTEKDRSQAQITDLYKEMLNITRSAVNPRSSDGYDTDDARLRSQSIDRVADAIEKVVDKEPLKTIQKRRELEEGTPLSEQPIIDHTSRKIGILETEPELADFIDEE